MRLRSCLLSIQLLSLCCGSEECVDYDEDVIRLASLPFSSSWTRLMQKVSQHYFGALRRVTEVETGSRP